MPSSHANYLYLYAHKRTTSRNKLHRVEKPIIQAIPCPRGMSLLHTAKEYLMNKRSIITLVLDVFPKFYHTMYTLWGLYTWGTLHEARSCGQGLVEPTQTHSLGRGIVFFYKVYLWTKETCLFQCKETYKIVGTWDRERGNSLGCMQWNQTNL